MSVSTDRSVGLRERKKARTRAAIQSHALRLFREQGYEATTVQQIIEEVEISQSTFFRYFPTKADVVLTDEFDPVIVTAFREQPEEISAIQGLRAAISRTFAQMSEEERHTQRDRLLLVLSVPELRAGMLDQFASAMSVLAQLVAERTKRTPDDITVRVFAGAVVGALMAAMFAITEDPGSDFAQTIDEAMAHIENSLHL